MPYRLFNVLAASAALGYLLIYSFWPVSLAFGHYEGALLANDPKSIGLTDYYSFLRYCVLPGTCLLLALGVLFLLVDSALGGFKISTTFTMERVPKWSTILVLGSSVCTLVLWCSDPGGFWFWFFD